MLVRSTPRAVSFFKDLAALGKEMQSNTSTTTKVRSGPGGGKRGLHSRVHSQTVRAAVKRYHAGLYDQSAVVYLLRTPTHRAAVTLQPVGGYGLHSHFVANLPLPMIGARRVAIIQGPIRCLPQRCGACRSLCTMLAVRFARKGPGWGSMACMRVSSTSALCTTWQPR